MKPRVETVLTEFHKKFMENSFEYLYESDIKVELTSMLKNLIPEKTKIPGGYKNNPGKYKETDHINISLVRTEYLSKFDIAIIDDGKIESYESFAKKCPIHNNDFFWLQPVKIAIELKYQQINENKVGDFLRDIRKLQEHNKRNTFIGTAILFIQSYDREEIERILKSSLIRVPTEVDRFSLNANQVNAFIATPYKIYKYECNNAISNE